MRIALVTELFYPSVGGQEYRFLQLAKGLVRQGIKVEVYTTDHIGSLPKEEIIEGISVKRFVTLKKYVKPGSRGVVPLMKYVVKVRKVVEELIKEYDYILMNQMPILHLFFTSSNAKIVVDWCETYEKGYLKYVLSRAAKRFKKGTAVSEDIAYTIKLYNPYADVEVIRTPIDVNKYACNEGEKDEELILFVGRLVPHKNLLSLVRAVQFVNAFSPRKWKLAIVGDGPLRQTLVQIKKEANIEVLGRVPEEEKIKLIRKAYILAIPSLREGFPNIVAEAIVSCTPVLTVRAPLNNVYRFIERHGIGFVAPSPKFRDIAKTLTSINTNTWYSVVANERRLRDEFREENVMNKLLRFLKG